MQDVFLKDVQVKTRVALEDTNLDLPLCRDLSSNRLVAIPPNLFLLLEDLLQLWVLFAQIWTKIHSSEYESSSVDVLLGSLKTLRFQELSSSQIISQIKFKQI